MKRHSMLILFPEDHMDILPYMESMLFTLINTHKLLSFRYIYFSLNVHLIYYLQIFVSVDP